MANGTAELRDDILEQEVPAALALIGGADIDIQVKTAKAYPRSITTFVRKAQEMATLTPEIATSCIYAMPRDGRTIEGPSARLAEICASAWGNIRIEGKVVGQDDHFVTSRGTAWDVETNVAIAYEVRRRITNRKGETYNDDMIVVTGNAAASIAIRNAVLKAIPTAFWRPIYNKCRQVVAGDAKTFAARRDEMLKQFAIMGVTAERLSAALGVKGIPDITLEHMATLAGFYTALKDGDTTIEEAFPEGGGMATLPTSAPRKSSAPPASPATPAAMAPPAPPAVSTTAPPPMERPAYVGTIAAIDERAEGIAVVRLQTGFACATRGVDLIASARRLQANGTIVELSCRPAKTAGNAPVLEEILPVRQPGEDD